jgi:FKBP-type peptidyl-prolyl cis-trans isomerase FkpA
MKGKDDIDRPAKVRRSNRASTWLTMLGAGLLGLMSAGTGLAAGGEAGLEYWEGIDKELVTTESGLQYKVLIMGKGRRPTLRSEVEVHYRGLLENGVVFDTSYNNDEPVKFRLRTVIEGWQEGIQLMPEGSVFVFKVPPELAYGERSAGIIPPNATLIFEIELYDSR